MPKSICSGLAALVLIAASLTTLPARAQVSVEATPKSFQSLLAEAAPTRSLPAPRAKAPLLFRRDTAGLFIPDGPRGTEIPVDLGFDNAGRWQELPDGGRLWQLRLDAGQEGALHLVYDDFWMPPGAQLFLYNDDRSVVRGAFTALNNKAHGGFATDFVEGEALTLEYYEPAGVPAPGRLHVSAVVHRAETAASPVPVHATEGPYTPTSLPCSINTACPEGDAWQDAINATVKISNGCTGVLVNNTDNDETPYVLTVNHCASVAVGDTLNWTFQFNYQSSTCADPAQTPSYQSISGGVVRAAEGGSADFTLIELLEPIPASYGVHYAGWSIEDPHSPNSVVIGHPSQDIKKIAIDDHTLRTYAGFSDYWEAIIDRGVIEGGSSGSPLFNAGGQLVGVLRGFVDIDLDTCSGGDDNYADVIFPKLSFIWNRGPVGQRLIDFLDPAGGATSAPSIPGSGANAPADIWINEINADASPSQDDEFVEVVGPPGTDLTGYELAVFTCSAGSLGPETTHTIGNVTLQNEYGDFGVYVVGGTGLTPSVADETFAGNNTLPNTRGRIVLRDAGGSDLFSYQYDATSGGTPINCPDDVTTRSLGDAAGDPSMGFAMSNPTATDPATYQLTASPGSENADGGQVLPVELVAFSAILDGDAVTLRWETASELNNAGFEIQQATANDHWQPTGWIDGHGTTDVAQRYHYRLDGLLAGTYRFRLKQLDYDGAFEYSPEVEVAVGLPTAYHLTNAFPNPFNPETTFSLSVAQRQHVSVGIFDLLGRRVALLHDGIMESETTQAFRFEADDLPSGLYLVRALGERFAASQTITLLK